jgi:ABC-type glycerol-3-phosphate transport system substrate-binding protein
VFAGSKHPNEGKKFLEFITRPENNLKFSHTVPGHLIPPLKSVLDMPELYENPILKKHPEDVKALFEAANFGLDGGTEAGAYPDENGVIRKSGVFNPYMGAIFTANIRELVVQKLVLQNIPANEAVKWGAKEMERVVKQQKRR